MATKNILKELKAGETYTCEQLRNFIAYDRFGSIIFCTDSLMCKDNPQARFTVEEILEGYISRRRNDYKNHFDARQKIYIVARE